MKERLGWTCRECRASAEQQHLNSTIALKIPFVLQKGRTVYLNHEQKRYIGQEILCMTGDSINVRRSYVRSFYIRRWAGEKAGLSASYTKAT